MQKHYRQFGLIFTAIGLSFVLIGIFFAYQDYKGIKNKIKITGTVVEPGPRSKIAFKIGHGVVYHTYTSVESTPPAYDEGEKVNLYVDPEDPQNAKIDSILERWFIPLMMSLFSFIFGGIGVLHLFLGFRRDKIKELKSVGIKAVGRVVRIDQATNVEIDDQNPWFIEVEVRNPKSGKVHRITSFYDLQQPQCNVGDSVEVYFDPKKETRYFIDAA